MGFRLFDLWFFLVGAFVACGIVLLLLVGYCVLFCCILFVVVILTVISVSPFLRGLVVGGGCLGGFFLDDFG